MAAKIIVGNFPFKGTVADVTRMYGLQPVLAEEVAYERDLTGSRLASFCGGRPDKGFLRECVAQKVRKGWTVINGGAAA